jgi:tripartite-type tricarboxylate transporter receptor subunit TctC
MSRAATAQDYPTRPITIVVPFPAGGPTDALARVLADRMKAAFGQSVIVENPTGAAGTNQVVLTPGASTPNNIVGEVIRRLETFCDV